MSVQLSCKDKKLPFENNKEDAIVSKRIILSGDNLVDAQPRMDTQNNQTVVNFNLDRVGAKKLVKQQVQVLVKGWLLYWTEKSSVHQQSEKLLSEVRVKLQEILLFNQRQI